MARPFSFSAFKAPAGNFPPSIDRALKRPGDLVQRGRKNKVLLGSVHQVRTEKIGKAGPVGDSVRARLPAKPMKSVFVREPEAGNYGKGGPGAGTVRARLPAKPMNSVFMREPRWLRRAESRPGRRFGSRSAARKANKFGFCARTPVLRRAESRPAGRHLQLIRRPPKKQ